MIPYSTAAIASDRRRTYVIGTTEHRRYGSERGYSATTVCGAIGLPSNRPTLTGLFKNLEEAEHSASLPFSDPDALVILDVSKIVERTATALELGVTVTTETGGPNERGLAR
jgi:hypothetical protein